MAQSSEAISSPDSSTSTLSEDPSTLSAINAQLLSHGWTKRPLNLNALKELDYSEVVTVLFELLGSNVTNLENIDALSARYRTLTYENERLQKAQTISKTANGRLHNEIEGWKAKCADLEKRLMGEEVKVKELREEAARGRKSLEGVRVAALHEGKKSQMRMDKAQAQLTRLSNDASIASRAHGLVILNPIHPGRGVPVAANQSPLVELTIRDLVEIRQSLQEETEAFRHVLVSTGNALREVIAEANGEEIPKRMAHSQFFCLTDRPTKSTSQTYTHQNASSTSHPSLADAHLKVLINEIRTKMYNPPPPRPVIDGEQSGLTEEEVEEKKRIEREAGRLLAHLEERVKDLEVEASCAKAREDEANKLVEEYARVHAETRAAQVIGEDGDLEKQRNDLEAERKAFSEATQRLGEERRRLEGERRALLDEKKRWNGGLLGECLSPMVKPPPKASSSKLPDRAPAIEAASSMSSSGSATSDASSTSTVPIAPIAPIAQVAVPPSPWRNFQPSSPSPLSPSHHKIRSPRTHVAGAGRRKAPKTPLSRLVLEKAVLHRDKAAAGTSTSSSTSGGGGNVFGTESTRRTNVLVADKGKGKDKLGGGAGGDLRASTTTKMGQSALGHTKRDLSVSQGVGPKGMAGTKAGKAWR